MKHTPRLLLTVALALAAFTTATAQSNQRIDELLTQDPAQLGHTAYLVLSAAGSIPEDSSPDDAIAAAREAGLVRSGAAAGDAVSFGAFSYLLTGAFDVPGGVMYRLLPGPRYAAREVIFQGWSRSRRSPREELSGDVVVRILSVYLNTEGGEQ